MQPPDDTKSSSHLGLRLRAGEVFDGRFEVIAYIGCGGMGSVYKARHIELERDVALKIMHPRYFSDQSAVKRFQREGQIISGLSHPNILGVYMFGGCDGFLYLAMEYVRGASLGERIATKGPMALNQALPLLIQICEAMSHAHNNNVLHRDLKPDNVMIVQTTAEELTAKVVDFGLAKLRDASAGQRLTRTGDVVGDPRYMSPEQCQGTTLDERDDVYSFGCLMYEILTGQLPFDADDPVSIMLKHLNEDAAPFCKELGLPQAAEAITFTAMAKRKNDRYADFAAVKNALTGLREEPDRQIERPASQQKIANRSRKIFVAIGLIACGLIAFQLTTNLDFPLARARFEYSVAPDSKKSGVAAALAEKAIAIGRHDIAEELYREAKSTASRQHDVTSLLEAQRGLGRTFWSMQRNSEAAREYQSAITEMLTLSHNRQMSKPQIELCSVLLSEYGKIDPTAAVRSANELAKVLTKTSSEGNAELVLTSVMSVGPPALQAQTALALARLNLQQHDGNDAERFYDRLIDLNTSSGGRVEIIQTAATDCIKSQEFLLATRFLTRQLMEQKIDPSQRPDLELQLGDCYYRAGRYTDALHSYEGCLQSEEKLSRRQTAVRARTLHGIGACSLMSKKYSTAEVAFLKQLQCLKSVPTASLADFATAKYFLCVALNAQEKFDASKSEICQTLSQIENSQMRSELSGLSAKLRDLMPSAQSKHQSP